MGCCRYAQTPQPTIPRARSNTTQRKRRAASITRFMVVTSPLVARLYRATSARTRNQGLLHPPLSGLFPTDGLHAGLNVESAHDLLDSPVLPLDGEDLGHYHRLVRPFPLLCRNALYGHLAVASYVAKQNVADHPFVPLLAHDTQAVSRLHERRCLQPGVHPAAHRPHTDVDTQDDGRSNQG